MLTEPDSFDWANLPADLVRAFARELSGGRPSTEKALDVLRQTFPTPDADFFRHYGIRWAAANTWLRDDEAALDQVYGTLRGGPIPAPRRAHAPSRRTKLRAVREAVDPPSGGRQTEPVRQALVEALLTAGGGLGPPGEGPALRPFNVVPTRVGETLPLHPHQADVVDALRAAYEARGSETVGVIVMPTGSGKTVTAVHWLLDHPIREGAKVLWVTHRQELLNQTAAAFVRCAPLLSDVRDRLAMRLVGGGYGSAATVSDDGHDVVVASIGSLARNMPAVRAFLEAHRCVVVFDEAHHAVARTWREVLMVAREVTDDAVIGLTATPTRMAEAERRLLGKLFEETIAEVTSSELVGKGYLAEARTRAVETHVDAEALSNEEDLEHLRHYGELSAHLAHALAVNVPRNRIVVDTYTRGPEDPDDDSYGQTIVFAVNVDHAHVLAKDFAQACIPAGALTAAISTLYRPDGGGVAEVPADREQLLQLFRDGEIPVLVNVQVLTEGVDVPSAKTAFLARPTGSQVLMNQMVGRVLRGEEVGGTAHAYLVSFRDHWEQFPDWADPIRLLPPADVPPPVVTPPSSGPVESIAEAEWRRLLEAAVAEVRERIPATVSEDWIRVPVGVYRFETELPIDDEWASDDEVEARHIDLYVHQHELGGYELLAAAVKSGHASADAEAWLLDFFEEVPVPRPPLSRLSRLSNFVAAEGRMPEYVPLVGRERVNPRPLAKRLYEQDARREERGQAVAKAYAANPALVDAFYGGEPGLRRAVLEELYRLEAGLPRTFDEIRVPYVRRPDRVDHEFGQGVHDLHAILDRVRTDSSLFPGQLPAPAGGIRWTRRPFGSVWGRYVWSDDAGSDLHDPYIEINVLLDATNVDAEIVEFLIYHELLHHEDIHFGSKLHPDTGTAQSPHDRDFREREARHSALVKTNTWLDTFEDRLAAIDAEGRSV